ncbi:MAG: Nif3-like dinuclear metal center hexameric protein [Syntrophomonadales bacterium]|jgi:dinuclear metal center YbgI/SA1388 family protein
MRPKANLVFNKLEELAPLALAESWDNSGLQIGSRENVVEGVLVTLDVDEQAVDMALEVGANLIVSHHPLLFQGVKVIDYEDVKGRLIKRLIAHDLNVYSAHTNLDLAPQGLSEFLAHKLGLGDIEPLGTVKSQHLTKLVVFVPESHLESVRQAINDSGAGFLGNYRDCSFRTPGVGTFRPLEGSQPYLGSVGIMEEVAEFRLEVIVAGQVLDRVIRAMIEAHPYEEVAYDLIPLNNSGQSYSYGRQGELPCEMAVEDLAEKIKTALGIDHVAVSGGNIGKVKRVGLVPGSGASMIRMAGQAGCQALITSDVKYHEAREAMERGLAIIDPGHDGLELAVVDLLSAHLKEVGNAENWDVPVYGLKVKPIWRKT